MKQESFDQLVNTIHEIKLTLNDVQHTGQKTHDQAVRTNSRVDKLEEKYENIEENIHTLKRYRAGRYVDCPNREDIDTLKANLISQKAVKREMRFWFLGIMIPILGLAIAFLSYMT